MKRTAIIAAGCFALASACTFGKNAADLSVAKSASGTMATYETEKGSLPVELLAVRDEGLVLQDRSRRILFAPYASIRRFSPQGLGGEYTIARGEQPSATKKAMLRSISHYPQGLSGELERTLLDRAGQRELLTLQ